MEVLDLVNVANIVPLTAAGETTTAQGQSGGIAGLLISLVPLLLVVVLMYFMLIRPQKKQQRELDAMCSSIAKGDIVTTKGGIVGIVVNIKDDVLIIESSNDRTKLKIYRWAIRGKEAEPTETVEAPKDANKDAK